jgi:hypothetical protein
MEGQSAAARRSMQYLDRGAATGYNFTHSDREQLVLDVIIDRADVGRESGLDRTRFGGHPA